MMNPKPIGGAVLMSVFLLLAGCGLLDESAQIKQAEDLTSNKPIAPDLKKAIKPEAPPPPAQVSLPKPKPKPPKLGDGVKKARLAYRKKNYPQAIEYLTPLVKQGNPEAARLLGDMHFLGLGVEKNDKEAAILYQLSANGAYAPGQYALGNRYAKGQGVEQDLHKALKLYNLAAKQGHLKAIAGIGWIYDEGLGVDENNITASHWYKRAALRGNAAAQYALGVIYEGQKDVKTDLASAYAWLSIAASHGHKAAKKHLPIIAKKMSPMDFKKSAHIVKAVKEAG